VPNRRELARSEWGPFVLSYNFAEFPRESLVVDVGCGDGAQLSQLAESGCIAFGVDVNLAGLIRCRQLHRGTVQARAEELPIRSGALDGVVCKVALPYTAEALAIGEIARVLRPGGNAVFCCHAVGYYLRHILFAPCGKRLFYSLRTFVNTWFYILAHRRLPGFLGDTIYQSRRRLGRYYKKHGLLLIDDRPTVRYRGLPVFLYHRVVKVG
jgi:SAM-dependent methyltransferase